MKFAKNKISTTFSVKFIGEEGSDGGGLSREFFDIAGKEMRNPER